MSIDRSATAAAADPGSALQLLNKSFQPVYITGYVALTYQGHSKGGGGGGGGGLAPPKFWSSYTDMLDLQAVANDFVCHNSSRHSVFGTFAV